MSDEDSRPSGRHILTGRRILSDPGIILLIILLAMSAVIFIWWPTDPHPGGVALVGWIMFATMPVSVALAGIYVLWMERLEKNAGKTVDDVEPSGALPERGADPSGPERES